MPKISVVIPVYNERDTVEEVIRAVLAQSDDLEAVVVDDGSQDGTREILARVEDPRVRVVLHERNQGKGAALRTGFGEARGEIVIIQDADLEYDPREYPALLAPIEQGRADVVFGSRFLSGPHRVLFFWHYMGNKFLTLYSNMLTNLNLTDMETCYKVFRREVLKDIRLRCKRFGIEPELTAKVARGRWRIYEVPISYHGRDYREGKKITWRDGVAALFWITWFRFFD